MLADSPTLVNVICETVIWDMFDRVEVTEL